LNRSTGLAAIALALLESTLLETTGANAAAAEGSLGITARAERPSYGAGGWRCPPGFVWRNAGRQDWLCVEAFEAERIARENEHASDTWIEGPRGRRNCRSGLVPRAAFNGDPVCVDPLRRESIRMMNLALYTDL
jgi:hypothetical protein